MTTTTEFNRLRLLWPDHLGLARGKYLPGRHGAMGTGFCVTTFGLFYDREIIDAPGAYMLDGLKDVQGIADESSVRASWEGNRTAVAIADLVIDGEPYAVSSRVALKNALAEWAELGFGVKIGIEFEGYLLSPLDGGPPQAHPDVGSMVYGTGLLGDSSGFMTAVLDAAERSGFDIESANQEFDAGQYEFTLAYDDALRAIDDAFLFRLMVREVAASMGLSFTALGRPFATKAGSGVHYNFSLTNANGWNAMADEDDRHGISAVARNAVGGLCEHHQALTAICAPTVNAYRRLQPGSLAGCWANWGIDHRNVTNRIPAEGGQAMRIESRLADGTVNLHLGAAAILNAARLGVTDNVDPGPPYEGDGFEDGGGADRSATTLGEALDHLEADKALTATFDPTLIGNFLTIKRYEAESFTASGGSVESEDLSEFEINHYLPYH